MWAKFTPISPHPLDKLKSSPLSRADVSEIGILRLHRKHVSYTCLAAEGIGRPQDAALLRGSANSLSNNLVHNQSGANWINTKITCRLLPSFKLFIPVTFLRLLLDKVVRTE
jgi:hypothetical protein